MINDTVTITAKTLSGLKVTVNTFDVIIDNGSRLLCFLLRMRMDSLVFLIRTN